MTQFGDTVETLPAADQNAGRLIRNEGLNLTEQWRAEASAHFSTLLERIAKRHSDFVITSNFLKIMR